MVFGKKLLGSVAMASMLVTSTAPALARPGWGYGHPGHYRPHYRHYRGGGDGFGNFLLGAIVAGGIVAVASAASKDSRERRSSVGNSYPDRMPDDQSRNWSDAEQEAANICADAAEASRRSGDNKVDDIKYVDSDGEGYRVEGVLQDGRAFNCGVRNSELSYIQFEDRVATR